MPILGAASLTFSIGAVVFVSALIAAVVYKMLNKKRVKTASAAEVRKVYKQLDPNKRRSLQPGNRIIPEGWTEAEVNDVIKQKPKPKPTPKVEASQLGTKPKPHQPGVRHYDKKTAAENAAVVNHKFFGSQLTVGGDTVVTGLSKRVHTIEITKTNQVFVDNNEIKINHDTVMRVKRELFKQQNP